MVLSTEHDISKTDFFIPSVLVVDSQNRFSTSDVLLISRRSTAQTPDPHHPNERLTIMTADHTEQKEDDQALRAVVSTAIAATLIHLGEAPEGYHVHVPGTDTMHEAAKATLTV